MRISFDRVAEIYDKTRGPPPEVMRKVVEVIVQELTGHKTVLDMGVGTGRFAKPLQENGFQVVGIDISRDMMRKARKKGVENLLLSDACFLPFRNSSFDAVLSVHVLHLISDWQKALKEICRVTKDLMFSTAHIRGSNPISRAYEELAKVRGYDVQHVGLHEQDFMKLVKPAKSILVASWVSSTDERLTYLRQRASSRQWRIPENVDKQIVNKLIRRFSGQKYRREIQVLEWNIKDIKSYINNQKK